MAPRIISAALAVALVGAAVALILTGHGDRAQDLIIAGIALAGAVGTAALPSVRQ